MKSLNENMHYKSLISPFVLIVCLLLYSGLPAQTKPQSRGWLSFLEVGPSFFSHHSLNNALHTQGFGQFNHTYFSLGGGFDHISNRLVLGGKIYGYVLDTAFVNGNQSSLMYNHLNFRLGYLLTKPGQPTLIYPSLGIGAGLGLLRLQPLGEPLPTKHQVKGGLLDAAINLQQLSLMSEEDNYSLNLGLSVGYLYTFGKSWELHSLIPEERVGFSPQGIYLRIVLGVGQMSKKLPEKNSN
ncbi:MAG: hypothetical protein D6730_04215 [Bacteroidetes bacterium]|nr:MAG: hypothetical protein D6730_04215 [Bacteroidota bacterium]